MIFGCSTNSFPLVLNTRLFLVSFHVFKFGFIVYMFVVNHLWMGSQDKKENINSGAYRNVPEPHSARPKFVLVERFSPVYRFSEFSNGGL